MGSGMIKNLATKGGFTEVVICNRTRSKADAIAAAVAAIDATTANVRVVDTVAEVGAASEVVCICLGSEDQTDAAVFGPGGLCSTLGKSHIVLDHSTVSPKYTAKLCAAVTAAGGRFLDAPISGGPEGAAAGTLAIMCGGDPATFKAAGPVLHAMGATIKLMGGPGTGEDLPWHKPTLTHVSLPTRRRNRSLHHIPHQIASQCCSVGC
jgi:3-hydroxyisobutyrate dehydrogenase